MLNYIENNLDEQVTLTEISALLSRDPKYVGKLFRAEVGMSFKEYCLQKKIDNAKHLLLFSDKTINEISVELAYSSQSHFSMVFKKSTGITPYDYRCKRVYYTY
ncbi:helix-turn-helix domain-containing protein [Lapidilactobacillus mulanensis]|uniref:helix-turn-helix domain-containing protein n=1 Tax=Lapidilactobacillus mulanensis TaxID=2485999 RepID=UPI0013DE0F33|nr:AraC family transcriptional regulator [Lapidilactobacillus mulanensis]